MTNEEELYDEVMDKILHHVTLIEGNIIKLDAMQKSDRDQAMFTIKREINTIKRQLGRIHQKSHKDVQKIINELGAKGTKLCGLNHIHDFTRNKSAISMWASSALDIRLNTKKSPWSFFPDVTINLGLINIDTGPSLLDI